ncbi:hypothetical protein V2P20_03785 [Methylobacter sp. Wu1]|uniref:hypothetical protein n=1 Tax=Methylobacter sp. Wu1 TaxID=3119359 RepID=UPI002F9532BF
MRFSKQMGCFYPTDINYPVLPDDIIDVSNDDYDLAMNRSLGDMLDLVNGRVVIVPKPAPTDDELWKNYQQSAKAALDKTSVTIDRIAEAVSLGLTTFDASDVVEFMQYRRNLRTILNQAQPNVIPDSLPTAPDYPAGT